MHLLVVKKMHNDQTAVGHSRKAQENTLIFPPQKMSKISIYATRSFGASQLVVWLLFILTGAYIALPYMGDGLFDMSAIMKSLTRSPFVCDGIRIYPATGGPTAQFSVIVLNQDFGHNNDADYEILAEEYRSYGHVVVNPLDRSASTSEVQLALDRVEKCRVVPSLLAPFGLRRLAWVCMGSSAYDCQYAMYIYLHQLRSQNLPRPADSVTVQSLGFPVHFPVTRFTNVHAVSVAPLLDVKARALLTFALEFHHHPGARYHLLNAVQYEDFFGHGSASSRVAEQTASVLFESTTPSDQRKWLSSLRGLLAEDGHSGIKPPCSVFNDSHPFDVSRRLECTVGSRFMEQIQLETGLGHIAQGLDSSLRPLLDGGINLPRVEGVVFDGLVQMGGDDALKKHIQVVTVNEIHPAWVHFPLHLPSVKRTSGPCHLDDTDCVIRINGVAEITYKKSVYSEPPYHPALLQNEVAQGKDPVLSKQFKWPVDLVTATESKGKTASRQVFMKALLGMNVNYDATDKRVGLPFLKPTSVTEWFFTADKNEQVDTLWQQEYEDDADSYGFCARMNLYSIRKAYKALGFDGVRYRRTRVKGNDYVYTEPLLNDNCIPNALQQKALKTRLGVGRDVKTFNTGPTWIWQPPRVMDRQLDNQWVRVVRSPVIMISDEFPIKLARGLHFCKLVNPSRYTEWMLYDVRDHQ